MLDGLVQAVRYGSGLSELLLLLLYDEILDSLFFFGCKSSCLVLGKCCAIHNHDAAVKGFLSIVLTSLLTSSVVALALQISNVLSTQARTIMQARTVMQACKAGSLTKERFERNLPKIDGNRQVRGALNDVLGLDPFVKWEQENQESQSSRSSRPSDRMREILRLVNTSMKSVQSSWLELINTAYMVF